MPETKYLFKSLFMNYIAHVIIIYFVALFTACHGEQNHDHDHDHDGHSHGNLAGADSHDHAPGEIVVLPEQARVAGIQVETVRLKPFDMVGRFGRRRETN